MNGKRAGCATGLIVFVAVIAGLVLVNKLFPSIFALFAWIAGIIIALLVLITVLIIVLANKANKNRKKKNPEEPVREEPQNTQTGTSDLPPEQAAVLNKGRADLLNVRRILTKIHNAEVSNAGYDICASLDKLLQALHSKPEKITGCRQFLYYYIPTLGEVLTKYSRLEANGVVTKENTEKVINFLVDFRKASGKQYQSLFEDDKLDMTVDIEAMTIAIKRDGLLDDDMMIPPEDSSIVLDAEAISMDPGTIPIENGMSVTDAVNAAVGAEKQKDPVH